MFSVGVTTSTTSTGVVVLGSGMMTVTLVGVVVVLKSILGNGSAFIYIKKLVVKLFKS